MAAKKNDDERAAPADGLGDNPLAEADPLMEALYGVSVEGAAVEAVRATPAKALDRSTQAAPKKRRGKKRAERKPLKDGQTYRLVTFSFYEDDVARLDALLEEAKARGHKKANRSQIVRLALRQVDLDGLPDEI